jgi:predicted Zn-dependent protease
LLLVRAKRMPEAVTAFARATELDPEAGRYAYVYAVALESSGQRPRAIAELERAHALHPADVDIVAALAAMNDESGNADAALAWARKLVELAPHDPQALELFESLGGAPAPSQPAP